MIDVSGSGVYWPPPSSLLCKTINLQYLGRCRWWYESTLSRQQVFNGRPYRLTTGCWLCRAWPLTRQHGADRATQRALSGVCVVVCVCVSPSWSPSKHRQPINLGVSVHWLISWTNGPSHMQTKGTLNRILCALLVRFSIIISGLFFVRKHLTSRVLWSQICRWIWVAPCQKNTQNALC